jgi:hypothetical protein
LQWARSMGHLAQPGKSCPDHWRFLAQETKQGNQSPSSCRWLRRPIPASWRWLTRKGGAGDLAQSLRSILLPIGWRGPHRGGQPMVGKTAAERRSSALRMGGGRSGTSGRWAVEDEGEGHGNLGWAGRGWGAAVNSEHVQRKMTVENGSSDIADQWLGLLPGATQRGGDDGPMGRLRQWRRWVGWRSPANRDDSGNGSCDTASVTIAAIVIK